MIRILYNIYVDNTCIHDVSRLRINYYSFLILILIMLTHDCPVKHGRSSITIIV